MSYGPILLDPIGLLIFILLAFFIGFNLAGSLYARRGRKNAAEPAQGGQRAVEYTIIEECASCGRKRRF